MNNLLPTKAVAEQLLAWAHKENPGPWAAHCRVVARVAETIAQHSGLDTHRAYVSGLLHDIGRYEGVCGLHHIYAGYTLMRQKNYLPVADICLSHSFPYQAIGAYSGGDMDCTPEELSVIAAFLANKQYDDYDRLIQLGDAMGSAQGVCLMEVRLFDVAKRHGFNDFTLRKWEAVFEIKKYFDTRCQQNVYTYFADEIKMTGFR